MKIKHSYTPFLALGMVFVLAGCGANTIITGFTDPAYQHKRYDSVAVMGYRMDFATSAALSKAVCKKMIELKIRCIRFQKVFPPTRQFTSNEVASKLAQMDIASLLVLSRGNDHSASQVLAYQSFASGYTNGNHTTASGTSVPIYSYSRSSSTRITLIDVASRETVWIGDANTTGQGILNTTNGAFRDSLSAKIISALKKSNHF